MDHGCLVAVNVRCILWIGHLVVLYSLSLYLANSCAKKDYIPVGCILPAHWPYLPVCTALWGCLVSGGCLVLRGRGAWSGGCLVTGGTWSGLCLVPGGAWSGGCLVLGVGVCSRGGGWYPSMHCGRAHPPVDRMTDTCKNITFANFVCGR